MSFANLKKNSKTNFSQLTKKLEDEKSGGYSKDTREWKLEVDKAGNGYAVIRFLPAVDGEEFPFVKSYEYGFKDRTTGRWYIEKSRKTLGPDERDPVDEAWAELWNAGEKEKAKKFSRSTRYTVNILVISDPKNPDNEGKVFLYKFGPRIMQKIEGAMNPEFEDEVALNPFNFWEGANFKLKARKLDGMRSYDKCEFEEPSALFDGDDDALEKIWKAEYPLLPEIAPDKFKSYEQLKARFDSVTGQAARNRAATENESSEPEVPAEEKSPAPKRQTSSAKDEDNEDLAAYAALLDD